MSTIDFKFDSDCDAAKCSVNHWKNYPESTYICHAVVEAESNGFSAFAFNLPGVVGEGNTFDEAINDLKDAFILAISSYKSLGKEIPWHGIPDDEVSEEAIQRRMIVHV